MINLTENNVIPSLKKHSTDAGINEKFYLFNTLYLHITITFFFFQYIVIKGYFDYFLSSWDVMNDLLGDGGVHRSEPNRPTT